MKLMNISLPYIIKLLETIIHEAHCTILPDVRSCKRQEPIGGFGGHFAWDAYFYEALHKSQGVLEGYVKDSLLTSFRWHFLPTQRKMQEKWQDSEE